MRHVDPATLVSVTLYDRDAYLEKFPFGYTNASGSFKCVSNNPELEFDYSDKNARRVLNKHRKSSDCNIKQYDTNRGGNIWNEVVYARFLAKRDGIDLSGFSSTAINYRSVKLSDYVNPVKQAFSVQFYNENKNAKRCDFVTIMIPHHGYDCTAPAVEWELIEEFSI